jgi:hypothetical protein
MTLTKFATPDPLADAVFGMINTGLLLPLPLLEEGWGPCIA